MTFIHHKIVQTILPQATSHFFLTLLPGVENFNTVKNIQMFHPYTLITARFTFQSLFKANENLFLPKTFLQDLNLEIIKLYFRVHSAAVQ